MQELRRRTGAGAGVRTGSAGRIIAAFGVTVDLLALSIWLGGLIAIGAFVAPIAFHAAQTTPLLAGDDTAQKTLAGSIVGGSFRVYNNAAIVCGVVLLTGAVRLRRLGSSGASTRLLGVSVAAALAISAWQQYRMFPAMDSAQAAGNMAQFDVLHQMYVALSQGQLAILVAAAACYGWCLVGARR